MNRHQMELQQSQWAGTINAEEWTELSVPAMDWAEESATAALGEEPWVKERVGSSIMIWARDYLTLGVGQKSATAHGKQGLHPRRIALLRTFETPVRLSFWEGGKYQVVWIGINEPLHALIQGEDKTRPRHGWRVRDMIRAEGPLYFPTFEEITADAAKQNGRPPDLFGDAA